MKCVRMLKIEWKQRECAHKHKRRWRQQKKKSRWSKKNKLFGPSKTMVWHYLFAAKSNHKMNSKKKKWIHLKMIKIKQNKQTAKTHENRDLVECWIRILWLSERVFVEETASFYFDCSEKFSTEWRQTWKRRRISIE